MEVTLNIYTPEGARRIPLTGDRISVGRSDAASLMIADEGLSRVHASIHREGDRVWILDEGSTNGSYVNGAPVPPIGTPLADGDEIAIGNDTTIVVNFKDGAPDEAVEQPVDEPLAQPLLTPATSDNPSHLPLVAAVVAGILVLIVAVAFSARALRGKGNDHTVTAGTRNDADVRGRSEATNAQVNDQPPPETISSNANSVTPEASSSQTDQLPPINDTTASNAPPGQSQNVTRKLYLQMTPEEQMDFIEQRARHISMMMGNRPYAFNDDVLRYIKQYVDGYARRVGNNSTRLWGEDMRFLFARAREQYVPHIIRAFNAHGVPPVVGLYLVVVETEYHNIRSENFAGAAGLFQFIGPTARAYGVDPSERTNVAKMAPAAAAYMADRIAEFGPDSMSVALAIAGYNRSPDSVRRDLHDVLNSANKERSFWTLVANSTKLDHYFQGENIKYVPKFFAAAIVGETPWAFGLQMQPLSTYTEIKAPPETAAMGQE